MILPCVLCDNREWVPGIDDFNEEVAPFPCPLCITVQRYEHGPQEILLEAERRRSWEALRRVLYPHG